MLPQLFRPDPTMSGTNRGIIIGQDFILLTHHDIPPQPRTLYSTADCQGLQCINVFQISSWATGVKARRPDGGLRMRVQGGLFVTPPASCKLGLYHTRKHSSCCQLRSWGRWPGLYRIVNTTQGYMDKTPFVFKDDILPFEKWISSASCRAPIWIKWILAHMDELLQSCIYSCLNL